MLSEKQNVWGVISDSTRIIRSNSLHFLSLSLLFILPISLFNIIYTLTRPPTPTGQSTHYGRFLSAVSNNDSGSEIPPIDKSQIVFQILYGFLLLLFNLCSVSSITSSIFNGFHNKPLKFASSLKSILSLFFPLLATKLAYLLIIGVILFGFGFLMGFVFFGMAFLGFKIELSNGYFMAVVVLMMIAFFVLLVYLGVEWFLIDAVVVVELKSGFAPFGRSSSLMKGKRGGAFLIISLFGFLNLILSAWYSSLAAKMGGGEGGCGGLVALQMVVYAGFATLLSLFDLAAKAVFFIYCKAVNGESELPTNDKMGQVYAQLPHDDAVDDVKIVMKS